MEFWVKLLRVKNTRDQESRDDLHSNCTHIAQDLWLFEGDEFALDDGIEFDILGEEAIEAYGDLSGKQLKKMVSNYYGIVFIKSEEDN